MHPAGAPRPLEPARAWGGESAAAWRTLEPMREAPLEHREPVLRLEPPEQGLRLELEGCVQGIGLRPWLARTARALGLRGRVVNLPTGVRVEVHGTPSALVALQRRLEEAGPVGLELETWRSTPLPDPGPAEFAIATAATCEPDDRPGDAGARSALPLAPDLGLCTACLAELRDPASRRHRHPFVHCAACGPRYTMARSLPWERRNTAMADFPLCASCSREYADPADRRFHAETCCCPRCGPELTALAPTGELRARGAEALALAGRILREEGSVAALGFGGFQLMCDASSQRAVSRLRARKRRGRKPFALLVGSTAEAMQVAVLDRVELEALGSPARPIVVARRRPEARIAEAVAPGASSLGVMLPATPLQVLLLDELGAALVATSGNRADTPIVHRVEEAAPRLGDACDLLLVHDRSVEAPCDDSVVRCVAGASVVLRRARGYVPRALRLLQPVLRPVLALGAHWSNSVCLVVGDRAWPSPHVGDLDSPESAVFLEETARRLLGLVGVEPAVVAHDLHPGYESTRLAGGWEGADRVAVQHHHAHFASVLGESRETGPAYGLVWDGTGLGLDGTSWGGELLFGDASRVERLATFRPIRLPGGDRATREVWRLALAVLEEAFEGEPPLDGLALFRAVDAQRLDAVRQLLAADLCCPRAHGVGRLFDAVGALVLERPEAGYPGEIAMALEGHAIGSHAADRGGPGGYPFALARDAVPWQIDWRPSVRALVRELRRGVPSSTVAHRFHVTLVEAACHTLRAARAERSPAPVALSGGCFQNRLLVEGLLDRLAGQTRVLRPRNLPPGDGGLALGQALVADAMLRQREG